MLVSGHRDFGRYVSAIDRAFRRAANKHVAHEQSRKVLLDMAADESLLRATLAKHVAVTANLGTKNFPSLGFEIAKTPHYLLVANSFFPHPSGATDITCNSVHHHGDLLLTTVTAFGPGYEHWRFSTPVVIDPSRDLFRLRLLDRELHTSGHAAFVDAMMPHAVMFPKTLSVTYALWSSKRAVSWKDYVKRIAFVERHAKTLRRVALRVGLKRSLDLRTSSYYDYYPTDGGFCGMRERQQFDRGPNVDYLQNLFAILQATGNESLTRDIERQLDTGKVRESAFVRSLIAMVRRGERIEPKFSDPEHRELPHMNFKSNAIIRTLDAA